MNWVLFCFSLFVVSCQNQPLSSPSIPASVKSYVSLDLEYPEYRQVLAKLDTFLGKKLINRGEAHITVLTPPEFKIITASINAKTIHQEWAN